MRYLILAPLVLASLAAASDVTPTTLSSAGGRYVFGQVNDMARDQFMLDTKTGRLWRYVVNKDERPVLEPVPYHTMADETETMPEEARADMIREIAAIDFSKWTERQRVLFLSALSGQRPPPEAKQAPADADPWKNLADPPAGASKGK